MNKRELIENRLKNLKKKILKMYQSNKLNDCLTLISVYCEVQYKFNQSYTDSDVEALLDELSLKILGDSIDYSGNDNVVLFYDGFGLDLRGWAATYIRALTQLNYKVIYVTEMSSQNDIPHIKSELKSNIIEFFDKKNSYVDITNQLNNIFKKYKPSRAIFYTTPWDVSAAIAFNHYKGYVKRFQVDLTDHAFWLGVNSVDYFLESREMGASLAVYKRNVPSDRIIRIDSAPYINMDICEEPFPFDIEKEKFIFTGGALYKTLGDKNNLYYKIVDSLLSGFEDLKFIYAGDGDRTEINKLIEKYPNRAYRINERPDFFRLFKHCELYLNTYPMFGGLMMRYAALAHKVPLTLRHEHDADGILENQDSLNIQFDTVDEVLNEARQMLTNDKYKAEREELVSNNVITDAVFARNIRLILDKQISEYKFDDIPKIDTSTFQEEYIKRFKEEDYYKTFASKQNKRMLYIEPYSFIKGSIYKLKERG